MPPQLLIPKDVRKIAVRAGNICEQDCMGTLGGLAQQLCLHCCARGAGRISQLSDQHSSRHQEPTFALHSSTAANSTETSRFGISKGQHSPYLNSRK